MVALSISVEGIGLTWPHWKRLVAESERLGFAGLYHSDHFTLPFPGTTDTLELIVALSYLAAHTEHIPFGSLVAPLSFRDPVMLARQAAALDVLSGGRMILGVGAGWMEREHEMFGYPLGDVSTRMDRLADGLEVITRLLRAEGPVSHDGPFYHLRAAELRPRPAHPGGPQILVGGAGPRRTLPLVARYADIWSAQGLTPEEVRQRSAQLDALLAEAGRPPSAVKRTMITWIVCGRDTVELEARVAWVRRVVPGTADLPLEALLALLRDNFGTITGTPEEVTERIRAYGAAGMEEIMVQWAGLADIEGLQVLAEHVAPQVG
jgi:alkanesulfonate monooxygenase SsuD/methylene tetrahydromethanopterin reductase-like flavin-dependent oxidoreductase (luciferase family)